MPHEHTHHLASHHLSTHPGSTKASKGFWIVWYVIWVGLTGVCLVVGLVCSILTHIPLGRTGLAGLLFGLLGPVSFSIASFAASFWLISAAIQIFGWLNRPRPDGSAGANNARLNAIELEDARKYQANQAAARAKVQFAQASSRSASVQGHPSDGSSEAEFPPDQLQKLSQANHLMAKGEAAQAAPLFARLAEVLINANRPRRAANLHAQAAQAYAASHNEAATLTQARAALTLFLQLQMDQRAPNFYAYLTRKLTDEGMNGAVETLTREFGARVGSVPAPEAHQAAAQAAQHARLPTNCPKCGAPLRSNEVRWVEANTAECDYCGTPIQPGA